MTTTRSRYALATLACLTAAIAFFSGHSILGGIASLFAFLWFLAAAFHG